MSDIFDICTLEYNRVMGCEKYLISHKATFLLFPHSPYTVPSLLKKQPRKCDSLRVFNASRRFAGEATVVAVYRGMLGRLPCQRQYT